MANFLYNVWAIAAFFKVKPFAGVLRAVAAVALPAITVVYFNYLIFLLAPQAFWDFVKMALG